MASNINSNISVKYFLPPFTEMHIRVIESREVSLKVVEGSATFLFDSGDSLEATLHAGNSRVLKPATVLQCDAASILTTTGLPAEIRACETSEDSSIEIRKLFKVTFEDESYRFILQKDTQLHISVGDENSRVKFKALDGTPEILGVALEIGKEYVFPQYSSTLINTFTERQYTINIEGKNPIINVLARIEKPLGLMDLVETLNSHRELARQAERADSNSEGKQTGPNILILGPPNSGKTSLSHFFVNKAVGSGWRPLFVDLEVRRNTNSRICGVMSFVRVREQYLLRGEMESNKKLFFFGSTNPYDNLSLYLQQIKEMGLQVDSLFVSEIEKTRHSGVIVDICGLTSTDHTVVQCILESMSIKHVFIISDERYYDEMEPLFQYVDTQYIDKSRCIEAMDEARAMRRRNKDLRKYFENTLESPIMMVDVSSDNLQIFSTVFQTNAEAAAHGLINNIEGFPFKKAEISTHNVNSVLSVVKRGEGKPVDLLKVIKYFVRLVSYDDKKKMYRIQSPVKENEDSISKPHILIMGTIRAYL